MARLGYFLSCEEFGPNIEQCVDAGYDELYVSQIGPENAGFFKFYGDTILPRLGAA